MKKKKYKLRYLPIFYEDMESTINYITKTLDNPKTVLRLIDDVEHAILERLESPESFAKYESNKAREVSYYKIQVRNFLVFYVVLIENDSKVMEVRRFLYGKRDLEPLL